MKILSFLFSLTALASADVTIVPHPDVPCEPDKTIVWTAAMQAAFDRIIGTRADLKFQKVEPPNPLLARMRDFHWNEAAVLPKDGWFAVSGKATDKLAGDATEKWRRMTGPGEKPFTIDHTGAPGYAAFVGIHRDFEFAKAFSASGTARLEWGPARQPVTFFGIRGEESADYAASVRVLAYRPAERVQALQFSALKGDDTMVLYTPREPQPMLEAMQWVKHWREEWPRTSAAPGNWNDKTFHRKDDLRVPGMLVAREEDMAPLFKGILTFKGAGEAVISQARTSMKLEVTATGVKFEARAAVQDPFVSAPPAAVPRHFWFDRPFFLFLWRDGAEWPYAAVWFGSPEALVKS